MAKGRLLNKVVLTSQKINKVSEGAENLYYRILLLVDDYGRYYADPDIVKSHCYPKRKVSIVVVKKRMIELINIRLIRTYKNNGEEYLELIGFQKHQKFRSDIKLKDEFPKPKGFLQRSRNESVTGRIEPERTVNVTTAEQNRNKNRNNNKNKDKNKELRYRVIRFLNEKAERNFDPDSEKAIEHINGRIKEGATWEDFEHVILVKVAGWENDPDMNKFLRPETLFNKTKFESYKNERMPDEIKTADRKSRHERRFGGKNKNI